jgi:glycoside hydrolase-like protein
VSRFGVDEDWQRLTAQQLLAAGRTFAIGYVSEDATGKNITAAEVRAYLAAGVSVLLVYEYSTTAIAGGATKGSRDAGIAVGQARALGYPRGCAVAFAVDEDTSSNPGAVDSYCRAFTAACHAAGYRSMVYGGYSTVRYCLDHSIVDLGWQTYAWSHGQWDSRAAVRQTQNGAVIAGKAVDLDTAMVDDFGAWTGGNVDELTRLAANGDQWGNAAVTGQAAQFFGSDGKLYPTANVLHEKLDAIRAAVTNPPAAQVALSADQLQQLAQQVAALLAPSVASPAAVATAVVDEQARRLGNG